MRSHEQSYKGFGIFKINHRCRLNNILKTFDKININFNGKLADFGCSNGYIISLFKENMFSKKNWEFFGFDHSEKLILQAKNKKLQNTHFYYKDLNLISKQWLNSFDIVTCFETLEHVGNYRNAFINIYSSCKIDGYIIISIPNEKRIPGLLKYIGRKLIRKNPYGRFFEKQSELKYFLYLILSKHIEVFRTSKAKGYAPHLGFDWNLFEKYMNENFITNAKCKLLFKKKVCLNFNVIYLLEKLQ